MFLSSIIKIHTQNYNNLIKYLKLDTYIKKINKKVYFLNQLDKKNQLKNLSLVSNNISSIESPNLIKYIISINLLKKNTFITVTDIKGKLKFYCSAGFVDLKGKRKIKQPLALNNLIDTLETEAQFLLNEPLALHLTNINFFSQKYVLSKLEEKFFIIFIKVLDAKPYNGCRPRKLKRGKKRRKK